jgi:2-phosphoglycerate kinase
MATIAFDTLKYSKRLKDAGVPDKQAEAEAEALAEVLEINLKELATKRDLKDVETALRADLTREVDSLRRDMREMEQRMTIKLGGMMMAGIAIVATLVKLL